MRLFRRKQNPSGHQEYLDELISSIKQARREEEERPGLQAFVEADYFPGQPPGPPKVPPGVAKTDGSPTQAGPSGDEASAIADLEAYLSALKAADEAREDGEATEQNERP